jgi:Tol biopolymer transport system component
MRQGGCAEARRLGERGGGRDISAIFPLSGPILGCCVAVVALAGGGAPAAAPAPSQVGRSLYLSLPLGRRRRRARPAPTAAIRDGSVDQFVWVPGWPALLAAAGNGSGHIYLLHSDGTGKHDLRDPGWDYEPVPSPDGTEIAFDRVGSVPDNGAPQHAALYVASIPAGSVRQLTQRQTH